METVNFAEEKEYLRKVIATIDEELALKRKEMQELPRRYTNILQGDAFLVEGLMSIINERIHTLLHAGDSPYFGRMEFTDDSTKKTDTLYVGKTSLLSKDGEQLVVDWRSPVCNLYYDSEIGPTQYMSPNGLISGTLDSKRQIIIENKVLKQIFEVSLVTSDDILKMYLDTHANDRMKSIVASIQREQNTIIRSPMNRSIIVQGVAGSGKTSVALHRIAYLIYAVNNSGRNIHINQNQFMIIGPNSYFLNYISGVLPDMDVDNISQSTLKEIVIEAIGEKVAVMDNGDILSSYFEHGSINQYSKIKVMPEYLKALSTFINNYIDSNISSDFQYAGHTIISKKDIQAFLTKAPIQEAISNLEKMYIKRIKDNYDQYEEKINDELRARAKTMIPESKEMIELYKEIEENTKRLKAGLKSELDKYFKPLKQSVISLYRAFVENIENYMNIPNIQEFKKQSLKLLSKRVISSDDFAALLHIKQCVEGFRQYKNTIHVVIDEAQDLSINEFLILKQIFPNATFSIFGDLNQSIYHYRAIDGWDKVATVFDSNCDIVNMNKSYRTTEEVMHEANRISEVLSGHSSEELVRHGDEVKYVKIENKELIRYLLVCLQEMENKGYHSMAIITKTEKEATELGLKLQEQGRNVKIISSDDNKYTGGLCIAASYLVKGLEFDGTILCNVDSDNYSINSRTDMSLLYVAMTRSLHELKILYDHKLPELLEIDIGNNLSKNYIVNN